MEENLQQQNTPQEKSAKKEEPKLSLEEKLSNILGGSIPHTEAIVNLIKPKEKYQVSFLINSSFSQ